MKARDERVDERGKGRTANGILLADYSQDDAYLIQYAFKKLGWQNEVKVVRDGGEVINYLSGAARNSDRTNSKLPDVLLLDLNLPMIDGFDVLRWIRTQPQLRDLPVIILTDCNFVEDVNRAYRLGAHSFFVKTPHFKDAIRMCLSLQQYRHDVNTGKDAKMPEPIWPEKHSLSVYPPEQSEQPCFPVAT
jgi:CheY-like chemotaxis protein